MNLRNHAYAFALRWALRNSNSGLTDVERYRLVAQSLRKLGLSDDGRTVTDYYFENDVEENAIMLVGLGSSVRGNLFYLLEELNSSERFEGYRIYVKTSPETIDHLRDLIDRHNWHRTTPVADPVEYDQLLARVKYVLTEVNMPTSWVKKPGQVYINIWHGTPLKNLGSDKHARNNHLSGVKQRDFVNADYLLYPNYYTKDHMAEAYRVGNLLQGNALMLGYPRTGGMLQAAEQAGEALREQLAPRGENVFAYMPTWKDYLKPEQVVSECVELLEYLDAHLDSDQILYVNLHHKINDSVDYDQFEHIRQFPAALDTYQVLAVADALITDYSSVFFDYLATGRHIILYCPDLALYEKKRGTYLDIASLPFDIAYTKEAVFAALSRGKTCDDDNAQATFCPFDTSENARKLCSLFQETPDPDLAIKALRSEDAPNMLIFAETCDDRPQTAVLQQLVNHRDDAHCNLFVGCDKRAVSQNRKTAYPLLFNVPAIGIDPEIRLSNAGKKIRQLATSRLLPFSIAMRYLQQEYRLAAERMWGRMPFSLVLALDVRNIDILLALACARYRLHIFFTGELKRALNNEADRFSSDAAAYCLRHCEKVFVESPRDAEEIREINGAVEVIDCASNLEVLFGANPDCGNA